MEVVVVKLELPAVGVLDEEEGGDAHQLLGNDHRAHNVRGHPSSCIAEDNGIPNFQAQELLRDDLAGRAISGYHQSGHGLKIMVVLQHIVYLYPWVLKHKLLIKAGPILNPFYNDGFDVEDVRLGGITHFWNTAVQKSKKIPYPYELGAPSCYSSKNCRHRVPAPVTLSTENSQLHEEAFACVR